jgi:hypothetical protein
MAVSSAKTAATRLPNSGVRVDARANRRAAHGQFQNVVDGLLGSSHGHGQLSRHAPDFLAQSQRRGIHQVRAANFDHLIPFIGFVLESFRQAIQRGNQVVLDLLRNGDVDRGGKRVVGALSHVDMVVGMHRLCLPKAIGSEHLDGSMGNHLIAVHVAGSARSRLEHIDREFGIELAFRHLAAGIQHGLDLLDR